MFSCDAHRSYYQQQLKAAIASLQGQQQADLADLAQLNKILQELGVNPTPGAPAAATASSNGSSPVTKSPPHSPASDSLWQHGARQQQQPQRGVSGPMVELRLRLLSLRGALEVRAKAQRDMQQQLEAQVGAASSHRSSRLEKRVAHDWLGSHTCVQLASVMQPAAWHRTEPRV